MQTSRVALLFLSLAVLGQGIAHGPAGSQVTLDVKAKKASLVAYAPRLSPPLEDVKSDKKFFGPHGDFANDQRPVVSKAVLDKLKGPDQPYPALQAGAEYDRDFVKDENSDKGHWSAQFEYDSLRRKMIKEGLDVGVAADKAAQAAKDEAAAQGKADGAGKDADAAKDGLDRAGKDMGDADKDDADVAPPSPEALEELKKKVAEAEAAYEKEKKDFEQCEKALADAKKNVEELKAKQVEMEAQLAAETKLWEEQKVVRLNLKKTKEASAAAKRQEAELRLAEAKKIKAEKDEVLALKRKRSDDAQTNVQMEKAKLQLMREHLEQASLTLQKIRGYKPAVPVKSEAAIVESYLPAWAQHLLR